MVNFTLKGILERLNKLNYLASIECTEDIVFLRVKRRLLQLNKETDETLIVPSSLDEVRAQIMEAKYSAIKDAKTCSMHLDSYNDKELMMENINEIVLVETENI